MAVGRESSILSARTTLLFPSLVSRQIIFKIDPLMLPISLLNSQFILHLAVDITGKSPKID